MAAINVLFKSANKQTNKRASEQRRPRICIWSGSCYCWHQLRNHFQRTIFRVSCEWMAIKIVVISVIICACVRVDRTCATKQVGFFFTQLVLEWIKERVREIHKQHYALSYVGPHRVYIANTVAKIHIFSFLLYYHVLWGKAHVLHASCTNYSQRQRQRKRDGYRRTRLTVSIFGLRLR